MTTNWSGGKACQHAENEFQQRKLTYWTVDLHQAKLKLSIWCKIRSHLRCKAKNWDTINCTGCTPATVEDAIGALKTENREIHKKSHEKRQAYVLMSANISEDTDDKQKAHILQLLMKADCRNEAYRRLGYATGKNFKQQTLFPLRGLQLQTTTQNNPWPWKTLSSPTLMTGEQLCAQSKLKWCWSYRSRNILDKQNMKALCLHKNLRALFSTGVLLPAKLNLSFKALTPTQRLTLSFALFLTLWRCPHHWTTYRPMFPSPTWEVNSKNGAKPPQHLLAVVTCDITSCCSQRLTNP